MIKMKNKLSTAINWVLKNYQKLIILVVFHMLLEYLLNQPYINLIRIYLAFIPYILDLALILILFKPTKDILLKSAFILLLICFPLALIGINNVMEILGNISYVLIFTYVIISLKDLKSK